MSAPAFSNSALRSACVASVEPLPGSARPIASVRQFIELAVNMPEQEPQVGQAERSISLNWVSVTFSLAEATIASIRSIRLCTMPSIAVVLPASIGPPETNTVGMFKPQRGEQHAGRDLVAVRDADERVRAVRVDHIFDRIRDQLPAGQRIEHCRRAPSRCRHRPRSC